MSKRNSETIDLSTQLPAKKEETNMNAQPVIETVNVVTPTVDNTSMKPAALPIVNATDLITFDASAIETGIKALQAKYKSVADVAALGIDTTPMLAMLDISGDLNSDIEALRAKLGGELGTLYASLKGDNNEAWQRVDVYVQTVSMVVQLNVLREKLGLKPVGLTVHGKSNSGTVAASTRRSDGYLAIGTYKVEIKRKGEANPYKILIVATPTMIKAMVNGDVVWDRAQGNRTVSEMVNEYILPAMGYGENTREGAPAFMARGGYPVDVLLDHAPTATDTLDAILASALASQPIIEATTEK